MNFLWYQHKVRTFISKTKISAININMIYNRAEAIHYNIQFLHRRIISSWYQVSLVSDANCSCSSHPRSCLFPAPDSTSRYDIFRKEMSKTFCLESFFKLYLPKKKWRSCIINQKQGSILRQQLILLQHSLELHSANNRLKRWLEDRLNYPFPWAICNIYSR